MSNELESFDHYIKSEIEDLELTPSKNLWSAVEQKMERNAVAKKAGTIRRLRISLSLIAAAFCLFVVYHYYNQPPDQTQAKPRHEAISESTTPAKTIVQQPVFTGVAAPARERADETVTNASTEKTPPANKPENKPVTEEIPALAIKTITSATEKAPKSLVPDKITVLKYVFAAEPQDQGPVLPETPINDYENEAEEPAGAPATEKAVFVPNAFTPNGDGLNDIFIPTASEDPKEYKLSIYDRNGKLVFFTDNFKTGWDGRINNGGAESVRDDVYIWRIEMKNAKGDKEQLMGSLTLLK